MKFFLDTANLEEIKEISKLGIVEGVTTNPSLVAKEGVDFHKRIKDIAEVITGPISAEVISLEHDSMVKEARELARIAPNVVVKIPMTKEGLKAVATLAQEGIKTNVTLIFSTNQAILAANAGAAYVSPFVGRLDDIGHTGMNLVEEIVQVFDSYMLETEIIAASIRHPLHCLDAMKAGAHIATVPAKVIDQMISHPMTDKGIAAFLKDWEENQKK